MANQGSSNSFVARIWLEGHPGVEPIWRGHIQHIQGSQEAYFHSLDQMQAFLERISGVPLPVEQAPIGEGDAAFPSRRHVDHERDDGE